MVNASVLSWTICVSHPILNELWIATRSWGKNCGTTPRSDFTMARRLCGTAEVRSLQILEHWKEWSESQTHQRVWRGGIHSVPEERGITILGVPVGTPEFVLRQLEVKAEEHQTLLQRIPTSRTFNALLVLLHCVGARANFYVRTVSPSLSHAFATQHDTQIWRCFCALVGVDPGAIACSAKAAILPLAMGGLGLRSAVKLRHAAHWASWADAIQMSKAAPRNCQNHHPSHHTEHEAPSVQAIGISQRSVEANGFVCPSWEDLATGEVSASPEEDETQTNPGRVGSPKQPAKLRPGVSHDC